MARRGSLGVVLAASVLSGCAGGVGPSGDAGAADPAHPLAAMPVMAGALTIAGPRGFCIDEASSRVAADSAFVVLGSCAALASDPHGAAPRRPALLTATVAQATEPVDAAALDRMAEYFATTEGSTALAREGATRVSVEVDRAPDLVLAHVDDGVTAGATQPDHWRAVFPARGEIVTVTVSGYAAEPLSEAAGEALTQDFVAAIRGANTDEATSGVGGRLGGFLNGLLN